MTSREKNSVLAVRDSVREQDGGGELGPFAPRLTGNFSEARLSTVQ
jgi:hypothetical protein